MITIRRADPPECLRNSNSKQAYRQQEVVDRLWNMQHGKCCYCEAPIPSEGHGKAVEHWQPKAKFEGRINDWNNLLLACPLCNGAKSDKFPVVLMGDTDTEKVLVHIRSRHAEPALIDPTDDSLDPEEFINFIIDLKSPQMGAVIARRSHAPDDRGQITIDVIGLYRDHYRKIHATHIRMMMKEYLMLCEAKEKNEVACMNQHLRQFRQWVSSKCEYAALARAFTREFEFEKLFNFAIPKGCE